MKLDQKYFTGIVWRDFNTRNSWNLDHIFGDDKNLKIIYWRQKNNEA
ncbi:MAG: hypothetical protein KAH09_01125 [Desulfobacula sp.]|nr:hypothetical protein [Desulfobacula sp.]